MFYPVHDDRDARRRPPVNAGYVSGTRTLKPLIIANTAGGAEWPARDLLLCAPRPPVPEPLDPSGTGTFGTQGTDWPLAIRARRPGWDVTFGKPADRRCQEPAGSGRTGLRPPAGNRAAG